jgi:pimeloyl-ACP methyl ester carboxylesterase
MTKPLKILAGLILGLLLVTLIFIAATWAPDKPVSELTAKYAPAPSQFIDVDGMRVHIRDEGPRNDPEPIVLLHGTSASLHTWEGWASALKGERRVISFDLPGFGLTGPFPDNDYTMQHYVKFVLMMFYKLNLQSVVLVGNSFGGELAWETAAAEPNRVAKLVLIDAAGYPFKAESSPIGFRIAKTPVLNKIMEYTLPRFMVASSVRNVYGDASKVTPALVDRYYDLTLRAGNRRALAERFRQSNFGADAAEIKTLNMPTLILWGKKDFLIPLENADHFHADIVNSEEVILDGLGHVPHEEDPVATVAVFKHFLSMK